MPTIENQRGTDRVQSDQSVVNVYGLTDSPLQAIVVDESFGGLGIAVPTKISVGAEIDIETSPDMGGVRMVALVRHTKDLPSGTRAGVEWKAMALSRCLRDLLKAEKTSPKHQTLGRVLPGGLSMMWKLFEADRWEHLLASADRLRKESAACNVTELSAPIEQFQLAIRDQLDDQSSNTKEVVRAELDRLILKCLELFS